MPIDDDRFTGGDDFAEGTLERAVHLAMMTNELNGGRGAYRINNAGLGASGPSYGPFQYDLGANDRARGLFGEIAGAAVDANGARIIGDQDLAAIRRDLYQPFSSIQSSAAAQATYDRFLPSVNSALASDAGRQLINADYVAGIASKIEETNAVIAAVPDAANRTFLQQNRLAQLIILDTANQYGSAVNDGLHQFIGMNAQSESMDMPGRRRNPEQIGVSGDLGIEDMIRYKLETQYGQTDAGARDVLRRISNLVDAAGVENIGLSNEDREFLNTGLAQYLTDNGRNVDLSQQALSGLRRLAEQPAQTTDLGMFAPTNQVAPNYRSDFDTIVATVSRDGRWSPEESNNIAGSLLRRYASDPLMPRIDSVVVGNQTREGQTNVFAVYQPFQQANPSFHARVDANEAARVPLQESLQQLNLDVARSQQQEQQPSQGQSRQASPVHGPIQ